MLMIMISKIVNKPSWMEIVEAKREEEIAQTKQLEKEKPTKNWRVPDTIGYSSFTMGVYVIKRFKIYLSYINRIYRTFYLIYFFYIPF